MNPAIKTHKKGTPIYTDTEKAAIAIGTKIKANNSSKQITSATKRIPR